MKHTNQLILSTNLYQGSMQATQLLGKPAEVSFTQKAYDRLDNVVALHKNQTTSAIKFTRIAARTHTTKGTIDSWFLVTSTIEDHICNLRITSNHSVANLNGQIVFFHSEMKEAAEIENIEHQATDTFSELNQWLFSEIAMHLNKTDYFSRLHSPAIVNSLFLSIKNHA
ncbi:hypothetical protein ACI7YU_18800 [Pseudomonas siliginis]|uniref:hypothetical protein n=1 Tax=Pseudomonas siliginis TaxID=2842346 RepID=UPI00386A9026